MGELPTGTVTFLFTDIEGSTQLLRELGDGYASVWKQHQVIIREALAAAGGGEVRTEGDSFFVAFSSAPRAVGAAVTAQRGLASHSWPAGTAVRVRMGLHTGEGVLSGSDYVGMDVHRAARIASAAHGGQLIVSDATRVLIEHTLPAGTTLRDLGTHRLKDIQQPEHLYELVIEGLPAEFPPPRTLEARPNNLPLQLTSFVGREDQLAEIQELLGHVRLLTLTGPGGTGKTRLALQVAAETVRDYPDGAFFVDLSPVTDPGLVPAVIARALGVAEVAGVSILETLKTHLQHKELLLVVDNLEQLAAAGWVIEELVSAAPKLKVLITSRMVLAVRGEQEYAVPPLEPPDPKSIADLETLSRSEAVRLFTERALAVQPRFRITSENAQAVAEITGRLDGLPLAIELAATRVKVLTPQQMLPRLERGLSLLASGGRTLPERQRTLRGTIAWSYDLLEKPEQSLFRRLSVFSGGWTLEAAEAVAEPERLELDAVDGLSALVDKSLVRPINPADGFPRFTMLETIRQFGQEVLLTEGELDRTRRRHGEYFLNLALRAEAQLTGEEQAAWLEQSERELDNLRAALRWAIDAGEAGLGQAAAGALWRFWQQHGHLAEGRGWLNELLAMPSGQGRTAARAKALTGAGGIAWWQIDRDSAGLEESLDLFRRAEVEHGVARVLAMLVIRDAKAGKWQNAIARLEEVIAIWRRLGDRLQLAFTLIWLGFACGRAGRRPEARSAALEALALFRDAGNATGIGLAFRDLAFLAVWEGRPQEALTLMGAAESLRDRIGGGPPPGFGGMLEGDPVAEARAQLSEDEAERCWQQGRRMELEEALTLARHGAEALK
ncbi:MAG: adenylate/guanylate cyclase domain-containing protein [Chloroflexi bacterium]|nr:MAG: adenylate/guanylate cyclase domain-containing protein [Chloroflexota bacterium]